MTISADELKPTRASNGVAICKLITNANKGMAMIDNPKPKEDWIIVPTKITSMI
jgi:hypothetical protein